MCIVAISSIVQLLVLMGICIEIPNRVNFIYELMKLTRDKFLILWLIIGFFCAVLDNLVLNGGGQVLVK